MPEQQRGEAGVTCTDPRPAVQLPDLNMKRLPRADRQRIARANKAEHSAAIASQAKSSESTSKGHFAVSLYAAGDLLLVPPIRYASASMTADERQGLIECLEALSNTTKTALAPARLVDKFGLDVFSRLWRLFAGTKEGYWAVMYTI